MPEQKNTVKKSGKTKRSSAKKLNSVYRFLIAALSIVGIAMMAYLTKVHYSAGESFCDLAEGLSCHAVNTSEYAVVFGVPISILGALFFLFIFGAVLKSYKPDTLRLIIFSSIVFMGPSLYLTGIELFKLENICIFCELSKVTILLIIILSTIALRPATKLKLNFFMISIVIAALAAGGMYVVQNLMQEKVPSQKYAQFAKCLTDKRCKMYGSITCQFCAKQRELFGDSFEYVDEIECDPRNPDSHAELCVSKNIEKTPTWIIEDENGETVYRFETGVQSLEKLSEVTDCPLPD